MRNKAISVTARKESRVRCGGDGGGVLMQGESKGAWTNRNTWVFSSQQPPRMQRLVASSLRLSRLPLAANNVGTTLRNEKSAVVLLLLRHSSDSKSDLSRARLMKSPPSPTMSTEPPSRIPKEINAVQADTIVEEATKAAVTETQAESGSSSGTGKEEILYDRSPSWWIKWVWVLIGMDIIWS